ncbi:MAG: response regulator transcription factor [Leptospirales bacterium]|nr:response regulator transcription factor [Leptospirales bacterium]
MTQVATGKQSSHRVLIIDDDQRLQSLLREYLGGRGYEVESHLSGDGAAERVLALEPDLVVLDIMMPGRDGLEALRDIRARSRTPVVMLTARGDEADRIVGLELGADDYLPKPFNPRELDARLRAILRREEWQKSQQQTENRATGVGIEVGGLRLHRIKRVLSCGESQIELSTAEARLLETLMERPDKALSRDEIMNATRGRDFMGFERSIDVQISKLRQRLESIGAGRDRIRTVWGQGYLFQSEGP